ncbi:MAG: hypothetical protein NDI69_15030 [Bacteriovoracaceae bacterium]|nr:hypothetical protein [Bacteriovoracaceae bacterium]
MKALQRMVALLSLILTSGLMANGGAQSTDIERTEQTREKMKENPRNLSYPGSFGQIGSQEDQERQEEKEDKKDKDSRFIEETETIDRDLRY